MVKQDLSKPVLIALAITAALLLMRMWMLMFFPLYDTTEARYAEIARIMYETNNWVTPQFDYQQPFWGKPPLHTWLSAASFSALGISAFTARLPHFICGLLVLILVYRFARELKDTNAAVLSCLVLTSSFGFIVAMGMVMTDIALLLSISAGMISFWKAYAFAQKRLYGHLFFVSLALGMLIKGPVAIVLVGIALCTWCIWQNNLKQALSALPWLSGLTLFTLLTLPWYILAELRTPGFLQYFIVGEHFQRFLVSGWEGDLYGSAHDKPRGTIWLYWLVAAFPWSFVLIGACVKRLMMPSPASKNKSPQNNISTYLLCWMLSPMLLFTLSGNILIAYVLPGSSAFALLLGLHGKLARSSLLIAGISLWFICALPLAKQSEYISKTSERELLGNDTSQYANYPLYYWKHRPFSARFYSMGQATVVHDLGELLMLINNPGGAFVAAQIKHYPTLYAHLDDFCSERRRTAERVLLFCRTNP